LACRGFRLSFILDQWRRTSGTFLSEKCPQTGGGCAADLIFSDNNITNIINAIREASRATTTKQQQILNISKYSIGKKEQALVPPRRQSACRETHAYCQGNDEEHMIEYIRPAA